MSKFSRTTLILSESMGASISSRVLRVPKFDNISLSFIYTGTPTGTFSVLAGDDESNLEALTLSGVPSPSGSAGSDVVNLNQFPFEFLRVVYTRSSGDGSLTVKSSLRTLGG